MAESRGRDNWAHTSAVLAMIFNMHRDPKTARARSAMDFDPYAQAKQKSETSMADLRGAFEKGNVKP